MAKLLLDDAIDFAQYMNLEDYGNSIYSAGEYADDVVDYFYGTQNRGHRLPWSKADFKIEFRQSEVTVWSGFNGSGKSLALGQTSIALCNQKQKICIASLEMKPKITLARMCRQASCGNQPSMEFIRAFHKYTDKFIYLYDQQGTVKAEKMIGVMRYAAEVEGVNHFILDSFMKCGIGEDDFNGQKKFIDNICTVARDSGMHIHVVCHARKTMNEKAVPGKMDVKGTGAITDQVDNVINWWRNKDKENRIRKKIDVEETEPDAMLICDKQRNGEWEGTIGLWFDPASLQFVQYPNRRAVELIDIGF